MQLHTPRAKRIRSQRRYEALQAALGVVGLVLAILAYGAVQHPDVLAGILK